MPKLNAPSDKLMSGNSSNASGPREKISTAKASRVMMNEGISTSLRNSRRVVCGRSGERQMTSSEVFTIKIAASVTSPTKNGFMLNVSAKNKASANSTMHIAHAIRFIKLASRISEVISVGRIGSVIVCDIAAS